MYKQSPSRNQRSKGTKVKHVLQICVLVAICFWLVYQVKRSHDKEKEFDEHEISLDRERKDEVIKLGRRDLHPNGEEIVISNEKHDKEVEEEEEESTGEEEENKHEVEEQQDNATEETDNEASGGGDEEVDDHDQENSDVESGQVEDHADDKKEREDSDEQESNEKDSENSNDQTENDSSLQDQETEGGERTTHEAREENYKADDASSEVAHDTQISSIVNETVGLEKSNEHGEMFLEQQNTSNGTLESNANENTPMQMEDGKTASYGTHLAAASHEVNENTPSNSTVSEESSDQPEVSNNKTEVGGESLHLVLPNGNGNIPESTQVHSVVEGDETMRENSTLQIIAPFLGNTSTLSVNATQYDSNSTIYTNSESIDSSTRESLKLPGDTDPSVSVIMSNVSAEAEDNSGSSMMETSGATEDIKDSATDVSKGGLNKTNSETDETQHETIDSSNSSISLEEKDVRTDLETMPEIQSEASNNENEAVE